MDHVYEVQLLGYFFEYALGLPNALTCEEFNKIFVDTGRLQRVFDESPPKEHHYSALLTIRRTHRTTHTLTLRRWTNSSII